MKTQLSVARDFSEYPFGRYPAHGPHSGQRFRDEHLLPLLRKKLVVTVDLTGAKGLAPSFLEEAFGGLVRAGFSEADLQELLIIRSDLDPSLAEEAWIYVKDAAQAAVH